jgi:hypothetical protein
VGIKLIRSSPYYAQANGQAEASNQSLIKLIKRKIDEHPRRWHEVLSEALWEHCISCHGAIKTLPYHLVYRQETVLPLGTKDATYGKWSPNCRGPYRIDQVLPENAYMLEELDGVKFPVAVNG